MKKPVFYGSVGPELTLYDIDVADAALTRRSTVSTPAVPRGRGSAAIGERQSGVDRNADAANSQQVPAIQV